MTSLFDCQIKVNGKTGPVSRFLKDDEKYYGAVKAHLGECRTCDPSDILLAFLENRKRSKAHGLTSSTIIDMALGYGRKFGDRVRPEIIREYLWRGMSSAWKKFDLHAESCRLSADDVKLGILAGLGEWEQSVRAKYSGHLIGDRVKRRPPSRRGRGPVLSAPDESNSRPFSFICGRGRVFRDDPSNEISEMAIRTMQLFHDGMTLKVEDRIVIIPELPSDIKGVDDYLKVLEVMAT